jgi:hypothetical protein
LISIDGDPIMKKDFDEVLSILKTKQSQHGCTMKFLTVEEKLRRIRVSAMNNKENTNTNHHEVAPAVSEEINQENSQKIIKVEMRAVDSSVFMFISELDKSARPEYRVVNGSTSNVLHYRQKGINGGRWSTLLPGLSAPYIWDDTFKHHTLLVRAGKNILCPSIKPNNILDSDNEKIFNFINVNTNEIDFTPVMFDDIGATYSVPIENVSGKLSAHILSQGPTKLLKVMPSSSIIEIELKYSYEFMTAQISVLLSVVQKITEIMKAPQNHVSNKFSTNTSTSVTSNTTTPNVRGVTSSSVQALINLTLVDAFIELKRKQNEIIDSHKGILGSVDSSDQVISSYVTSIVPLESLLGPVITKCNTLMITVLEAKGLKPATFGGTGESYCEVFMKSENRSKKRLVLFTVFY